ncbi:hypothetical protein EMPS_05058 [Entomortierella parvispora]|uniref:PH domain-containing protein n=1 Tax=Entomortierella parvispora TaxID=205924 RepID=A0A9P3LWD4_9FUNG|nr:hypothetical protein EMPS_05058 [Entomortierella parvispora]
MPITKTRAGRSMQWTPAFNRESFPSPSPIYSGHLLKLGSNDRWQSRLFTFDGSVLNCVGRRPRAPVISTYNPHISSPFVSSPQQHTQQPPQNPNTKWSINITSVADIRLLSHSKTYRCFPSTDSSRSLLIQTNDGRTLTLRAKKDLELERWYFILAKIWSYQQLLQHASDQAMRAFNAGAATGLDKEDIPVDSRLQQQQQQQQHQHPNGQHHGSPSSPVLGPQFQPPLSPPTARLLPAHQQSEHLFSKYLQRQHQEQPHPVSFDAHDHQPPQPRSPQQQQQQHDRHFHTRPSSPGPKARESFLRYQLPLPRVSAFLPQGLDWPAGPSTSFGNSRSLLRRDDKPNSNTVTATIAEEPYNIKRRQNEEPKLRNTHGRQSHHIHSQLLTTPPSVLSGEVDNSRNNDGSNALQRKDSLERQGKGCAGETWSQELVSMPTTEIVRSASSSCVLALNNNQQPTIVWPCAGTMEPAKAAAIDQWRRSLLSPLLIEETESIHSIEPDNDVLGQGKMPSRRQSRLHGLPLLRSSGERVFVEFSDQDDEEDREGPISSFNNQSRRRWLPPNDNYLPPPQLAMEKLGTRRASAPQLHSHREGMRRPRTYGRDDDNVPLAQIRHRSFGMELMAHSGLGIHMDLRNPKGKLVLDHVNDDDEEEEQDDDKDDVPAPHLLNVKRLSRWQRTQLSSEDAASRTNRDSYDNLTNTPDLNKDSFPTLANMPSNRDSYPGLLNLSVPELHKASTAAAAAVAATSGAPSSSNMISSRFPHLSPRSHMRTGPTPLLSILKRPSVPELSSATIAAVRAAAAAAFIAPVATRPSPPASILYGQQGPDLGLGLGLVPSPSIAGGANASATAPGAATASDSGYKLTPSVSDPSLSLHGSTYSSLPIHDPDVSLSNNQENSVDLPPVKIMAPLGPLDESDEPQTIALPARRSSFPEQGSAPFVPETHQQTSASTPSASVATTRNNTNAISAAAAALDSLMLLELTVSTTRSFFDTSLEPSTPEPSGTREGQALRAALCLPAEVEREIQEQQERTAHQAATGSKDEKAFTQEDPSSTPIQRISRYGYDDLDHYQPLQKKMQEKNSDGTACQMLAPPPAEQPPRRASFIELQLSKEQQHKLQQQLEGWNNVNNDCESVVSEDDGFCYF